MFAFQSNIYTKAPVCLHFKAIYTLSVCNSKQYIHCLPFKAIYTIKAPVCLHTLRLQSAILRLHIRFSCRRLSSSLSQILLCSFSVPGYALSSLDSLSLSPYPYTSLITSSSMYGSSSDSLPSIASSFSFPLASSSESILSLVKDKPTRENSHNVGWCGVQTKSGSQQVPREQLQQQENIYYYVKWLYI